MIFGREVCGNFEQAARREWLVTNGLGGFASGTIAGCNTRRYHGLLLAALKPPLGRMLCVSRLEETVTVDGQILPLFTNQWAGISSGRAFPTGYHHLERFYRQGTIPVWVYSFHGGLLEKRVWMQPEANTTYIQYAYPRPLGGEATDIPIRLDALITYRDYHGNTQVDQAPELTSQNVEHGLRFTVEDQDLAFYLFSPTASARPAQHWIPGFYFRVEARRGENPVEDLLRAGVLEAVLAPGETLTVVASLDPHPNLDGETALAERIAYEQSILHAAGSLVDVETAPPTTQPVHPSGSSRSTLHAPRSTGSPLPDLILAADQFIVRRATPQDPEGSTVIAGYPWFTDWGRDTMISLPGLALATGRPATARSVLRTFAAYLDQGMLPNRFPDAGETPEYNTVDATLWYFEAIRAYVKATDDEDLLRQLYPALQEVIDWHQRGTRFGIHVDPADGLLYSGEPGVQLTWMDVKIEDWVVTPRTGKAVEINALWYNALCSMHDFARRLGLPGEAYAAAAGQASAGFARFWNPGRRYLFDVLDGPDGDDPSLRPNAIFAVSLPYSPLPLFQQKAVVDECARHLLTSHGLRSLAPGEPGYTGQYRGGRRRRDAAYHQGTVWGWLIGPFVSAHLRVYHQPEMALSFLQPLLLHLADHGLGTISEIFDGDPPFSPHGCFAQAWSVAEVLRVLRQIEASGF